MATHLNVSEMTVRRDIKELTADHTINFENGKIMFNPQSSLSEASPSYSLESEKEKRNLQKELIGKFAATLVEPNDTVIIDSGSTTEHLAHYCLLYTSFLRIVAVSTRKNHDGVIAILINHDGCQSRLLSVHHPDIIQGESVPCEFSAGRFSTLIPAQLLNQNHISAKD